MPPAEQCQITHTHTHTHTHGRTVNVNWACVGGAGVAVVPDAATEVVLSVLVVALAVVDTNEVVRTAPVSEANVDEVLVACANVVDEACAVVVAAFEAA